MCIIHFWHDNFIILIINPLTFAVIVFVLYNYCLIISCLYYTASTLCAILCTTLDMSSNWRTNTLYFTWNQLIYTHIAVHSMHIQFGNMEYAIYHICWFLCCATWVYLWIVLAGILTNLLDIHTWYNLSEYAFFSLWEWHICE